MSTTFNKYFGELRETRAWRSVFSCGAVGASVFSLTAVSVGGKVRVPPTTKGGIVVVPALVVVAVPPVVVAFVLVAVVVLPSTVVWSLAGLVIRGVPIATLFRF